MELGWDPGTSWQWTGLACVPARTRRGGPPSLCLGAGLPRRLVRAGSSGLPGGGEVLCACWPELGQSLSLGQSHRSGWPKQGMRPQVLPMAGNVPALARVWVCTPGHSGGGWGPNTGQPHWPKSQAGCGDSVLAVRSPDLGPSSWWQGRHACPPVPQARTQDLPGIERSCYTCGLDPGLGPFRRQDGSQQPRVRAVMQAPSPLGWRRVTAPAGLN